MTPHQEKIIEAAKSWVGTPYRHQASRMGVGCDCLGLVRGVWRKLYGAEAGIVPPYAQAGRDPKGATQLLDAADQFLLRNNAEPKPGNVVLFQLHQTIPPRHCAIIIDDNHIVHAQERLGVISMKLDARWRRLIHSTFTFPKEV